MNYLSVEGLAKAFGERVLFEGLGFGLSKGDKMALVANNGSGKSSLIKILSGLDEPDAGRVVLREGIRMGYLSQEPDFDHEMLISELISTASSEMLALIEDYNKALELQSEDFSTASQQRLEEASAKMDMAQAWDYERRLEQLLTRFNIRNLEQPIGSLSGGQKKRLALALVLLDNPDLILLDEPTNHLDVDMIEWLEKYLMQSHITLLMVTHDRYFLDRVCNHILELHFGQIYQHKGNYSYFLEKRAEREQAFQAEVGKAKKLLKTEQEWMRRQPKARGTKAKSRIDAFYETKDKASQQRQEQELKLDMKMSRMGGKILELKKLSKAYDGLTILKGFDYTFKKGERIGIVGPNGVGKSTFLRIIQGEEGFDGGKINQGETLVFGYYSQEGMPIKDDKRVIEALKDIAEVIEMADGSKLSAAQLLQHFLFSPDMQYTYVSKLSGGERRRLSLLMVLMKNPNFLILDEPTNDLDLLTLSKLEEFLLSFGGCLMLVSHDRYFMDVLVDHLFVFEGEGRIRDFNGTYSEYREEQLRKEREEKAAQQAKATESKPKPNQRAAADKRKLSYKEKREYEQLEKDIEALEAEKEDLEATMVKDSTDYEAVAKASTRLEEVNLALDEKTERWMELDEWV